jgi:hypothetical protein
MSVKAEKPGASLHRRGADTYSLGVKAMPDKIAALEHYGLPLKPHWVITDICGIYRVSTTSPERST